MAEEAGRKVVARNKKARHEYQILEQWEAGMVLTGPEVKSIRAGRVAFQDAFARVENGEVWLRSFHISPYEEANRWNTDPVRPRKLLLNRQEIRRMGAKVEEKGLSLVPLDIYFTRGRAKMTLGLGRGKKLHDKRESLKERAQARDAQRALGRR